MKREWRIYALVSSYMPIGSCEAETELEAIEKVKSRDQLRYDLIPAWIEFNINPTEFKAIEVKEPQFKELAGTTPMEEEE